MQLRKQQNWSWNNRLVPNREGSTSGCILSPCLFNFFAKFIVLNARLDEAQAGIKISGRNINNFRYADDNLMAENEEIKRLLMKVNDESEKAGLELNIQKTKIMASSFITSWKTEVKKVENSDRFYFLGLQINYG